MELKAIGRVRSCHPDKFGTPRQPGLLPTTATLEIFPEFHPQYSLMGLENFSHLWVLFWFHENGQYQFKPKVHPPRLGGESIGLFSTRSPHRPNPIGLSLCEMISVSQNSILLRGVDIVDMTPVVDIKPYLPDIEAVKDARANWVKEKDLEGSPEYEWDWGGLDTQIFQHSDRLIEPHLFEIIKKIIKLDPRPVVYRSQKEEKYRSVHFVRLFDLDVHFEIKEDRKVLIHKVIQIKD